MELGGLFIGLLAAGGYAYLLTGNKKTSILAAIVVVAVFELFGWSVLSSSIIILTLLTAAYYFYQDRQTIKSLRDIYGERPKSDLEKSDMWERFWSDELQRLTTDYKGQETLVSSEQIADYLQHNDRRIITTLKYICGKSLAKMLCDSNTTAYSDMSTLAPDAPIYPKLGLVDWWTVPLAPKSFNFRERQYTAFEEAFTNQATRHFKMRNA